MNSDIDNRFFSKLRSALGHDSSKRRFWSDIKDVQKYHLDAADQDQDDLLSLLEKLQKRSKITGMPISVCADHEQAAQAVSSIIRQHIPKDSVPAHVLAWRHHLIESLNLESVLATQAPQIRVEYTDTGKSSEAPSENQRVKNLAATALCGVTSADWCLADSATLVMRNRPGQERMTSLLPPVHIAVIPISSLITNLGELYALIRRDHETDYHGLTNCMTFVSGPSTTRDIESIAVAGAHGPKAVYIVLIR
jgi:L-lactate dehydrogenase complex protein LldG